MKQIHLFKKGFVIFLKRAPFSDFINLQTLSYPKPLSTILEDFFFNLVQASSSSEYHVSFLLYKRQCHGSLLVSKMSFNFRQIQCHYDDRGSFAQRRSVWGESSPTHGEAFGLLCRARGEADAAFHLPEVGIQLLKLRKTLKMRHGAFTGMFYSILIASIAN